jgi:hypothetical protein
MGHWLSNTRAVEAVENGLGVLALIAAAVVLSAGRASAQQGDPFSGTWRMNRSASSFSPGPAPERRTMTIAITPDGLKMVTETIRVFSEAQNGGGVQRVEFVAMFDGKPHPITGSALDTVSLRRIRPSEIERKGYVRSEPDPVETCTVTVSKNGKVLTMRVNGTIDGMDYSSLQVFERQ